MAYFVLTPKDTADGIISLYENRNGCFAIIVILAALITLGKCCEAYKANKSDKEWEETMSSIDSAKKDETIFKINNFAKEQYKITSLGGIYQINEMVGLPNDGKGFYFVGNNDNFIMGIKLKSWSYDRYYTNIRANDIEYTTREKDLTTATFSSDKRGSDLSFEEVVRLKHFYLEQEHTKGKRNIFKLMGAGALFVLCWLWLIKRNRKRR